MTARAVLDGIKAQLAAITPGNWRATANDRILTDSHRPVEDPEGFGSIAAAIYGRDAAFIAAAPGNIERLTNALEAVLAMADDWETNYGPGSRKAEVFGPQKVSIEFAVEKIRAAVEAALTKESQ